MIIDKVKLFVSKLLNPYKGVKWTPNTEAETKEEIKIDPKVVETKEEIKVEKKPEITASIKIIYKDGNEYGFTQKHSDIDLKKLSVIRCFYGMYRWFYDKKSEYYSFEHNQGCDVFVRSEITAIFLRKELSKDNKEGD